MTAFYLTLAVFLTLTLIAGLWRIMRGPSRADRMMAAQLFGTTAVAVLILLAEATQRAALRDVGLVFALLAVVAVTAFVRRAWAPTELDPHDHS